MLQFQGGIIIVQRYVIYKHSYVYNTNRAYERINMTDQKLMKACVRLVPLYTCT